MNEEKIMHIIKGKLLLIKRMLEEDDNDAHASAYEMQSEDFEAIQGLLDLYSKEKEKVKRYEKQLDLNFVSKDKIKAKIEEFKTLRDTIIENEKELNRPMMTYDLKRNDYCEKMLQSLLEEKE